MDWDAELEALLDVVDGGRDGEMEGAFVDVEADAEAEAEADIVAAVWRIYYLFVMPSEFWEA